MTPEPDWAEKKAREVAMSLPPSDFGSHRAIMSFAQALREAVKAERERGDAMAKIISALWASWVDADPLSETFTQEMERAGFAQWRSVKAADLNASFAAERGIERGGMLIELTVSGAAAIRARTP